MYHGVSAIPASIMIVACQRTSYDQPLATGGGVTQPDTGLPLTGGQRQWLHHLRTCKAKGQNTVAYTKAHGLKVTLYTARKTLVEVA